MAGKTKEELEKEQQEQEREKAAKQQEQEQKKANEKKAKLPKHVQDAQQEMVGFNDRMQKALDKLKFRLNDGTVTEQELAEIQTQLQPMVGDDMPKEPQKSAKELNEEPAKPGQLSKPRADMRKSEDRVQRMIDKCQEKIEKHQAKLDAGDMSEQETMESRQTIEDMLAKIERLSGGAMNAAEA